MVAVLPSWQCLVASALWAWLLQLRSFSQILVGIADNSVIPLPGSADIFTIWLAASRPSLWWYYALMATIGALVGGYITYFLARKGGKEALDARFGKRRAGKIYRQFERWGLGSVAIPALLPPPFPIVPSLIAAGALQFPPKKFLVALAVGRSIRFVIIAGLGAIYGSPIVSFFAQYYKPTLFVLIGLAVLAGTLAVSEYYRRRQTGQRIPESQAQGKAA